MVFSLSTEWGYHRVNLQPTVSRPALFPSPPTTLAGLVAAVAVASRTVGTRKVWILPCLTGPAMAIPPGTYRERLKSTRNMKREHHRSGRPTRFHPHRDLRGAERCDRPTDRFLASTAALNTFNGSCWIPRVPVLPLTLAIPRSLSLSSPLPVSLSLLLCSSLGLSVSPSRSAWRSSFLSRSSPQLLILFILPRPRTPLDGEPAPRGAHEFAIRVLWPAVSATHRSIADSGSGSGARAVSGEVKYLEGT